MTWLPNQARRSVQACGAGAAGPRASACGAGAAGFRAAASAALRAAARAPAAPGGRRRLRGLPAPLGVRRSPGLPPPALGPGSHVAGGPRLGLPLPAVLCRPHARASLLLGADPALALRLRVGRPGGAGRAGRSGGRAGGAGRAGPRCAGPRGARGGPARGRSRTGSPRPRCRGAGRRPGAVVLGASRGIEQDVAGLVDPLHPGLGRRGVGCHVRVVHLRLAAIRALHLVGRGVATEPQLGVDVERRQGPAAGGAHAINRTTGQRRAPIAVVMPYPARLGQIAR